VAGILTSSTLEKSLLKNTTPATPAISLMRSLSVQFDRIFRRRAWSALCSARALAARTQAVGRRGALR
jgi:hypothetical protein